MEKTLYALFLAIHNIILVLVAGGCYTMWQTSRAIKRNEQIGALERTDIARPLVYLRGLIALGVTGMAMPIIHVLYHGDTRPQTAVSTTAFIIKMCLVAVLAVLFMRWAILENKKNKENGASNKCNEVFILERMKLVRLSWIVSVLVLLVTPFVTFFQDGV